MLHETQSISQPITGEEHFIQCLKDFHGIEITHEDLAVIHKDIAHLRQKSQKIAWEVSQSPDAWVAVYEINSGRIGRIILGTALGFLSGGWLGAGLALLSGVFTREPKQQQQQGTENQRLSEQYGFDQGGAVSPTGGILPRIYCNRNINPAGGVRIGGILIHSRVDTRRGTNILYQLYAIAAGQSKNVGWGQIGAIAPALTLFNQQPRSNFNDREIRIITRLGFQEQSAIPEFPYYSQNIVPPDYSGFGIDQRATLGASEIVNNPDPNQLAWVTVSSDTVSKISSVGDGWNAGYFGAIGLNGNGFFQFREPTGIAVVGLANSNPNVDFSSVQLGFSFNPSFSQTPYIIEYGTVVAFTQFSLNPNNIYLIEIRNGQILYFVNGVQVYVSRQTPPQVLFPKMSLFSASTSVSGINVSGNGLIINGGLIGNLTPPPGSSLSDNELLDLFTPSQEYVVQNTGIIRFDPTFVVTDKNTATRTITTNPALSPQFNRSVFAYWIARYETTKRVDRVDFNLLFSLSARFNDVSNANNRDNGKLVTHASLFDVYIRPTTSATGTEQFLIRFVVKNRTSNKVYRGFRVVGLPLGRYYFELRPLTAIPDITTPVYELTDNGYGISDDGDGAGLPTVGTSVVFLNQQIGVQGEFEQITNLGLINPWIRYNNKTSVSSEAGPTGKINSVNEIVSTQALGRSIEAYPGIALIGYRFLASERLQQAPSVSALITEGSVVPNWLAAGTCGVTSTPTVLVAPGHNFLADGIQPGHWIRNLDQRIASPITQISATSITTSSALNWNPNAGDRFAVYSFGSTCYFPDVYADMVRNDFGGIPELLDPDEYLDYPSIVQSRKFCIANQYFWDDLTDQKTPFSQWASEQARFSYLYPCRIDGRFGLTPDTQTPIDAVFNAGNSRNFKLDYPDWQSNITNTVIIKFIDGREEFSQLGARHRAVTITVQTQAAWNGNEYPVIEEINARSVKNTQQAINIACLYLKTLRQNTIVMTFDTSYAAAYTQAGDIVSINHEAIDIGEDYSGFVTAIDGDKIRLNTQPVLVEGIANESRIDGLTLNLEPFESINASIGDLLVNIDTGESGIITSASNTEIIAPVPFTSGDNFEIRNLTMPIGYEAVVTYRENDITQQLPASYVKVENEVWLKLWGAAPEIMDYVNVTMPTQQWRIQSVAPNGKESFGVTATLHDPDIYSQSGLVIQVDDGAIAVG